MLSRSGATIDNSMYNKANHYFVTVCKHQVKDYVSKEEIDNILIQLKLKNPSLMIHHYSYELGGTYKQLHFHGYMTSESSIFFKQNSRIGDFRIYWKEVNNVRRVLKYIYKDIKNIYEQEQLITLNYYRHNYGFT